MDEMMKCGSSRVGGFMELLGFHQHFIPPAPPNFSSSSSSSSPISTTSNNSSSISILDHHHHHHHHQGPNDLVTLPQDHDQYSFKDRELINYSNDINYELQQQQQQPATPPTISSESCAGDGALTSDACQHTRPLDDHEEQQSRHHPYNPSLPKLKVRKSNEMMNSKGVQKKQQQHNKEARVAFVTRTEVDHLEDGFRWRKYGQKAVKNSPFPRSYYRCTDSTCNVKKRVERSLNDPTVVVTTYEGKHTHPSSILMHHHHAPSLAALPLPFTACGFASPPQITIPQNHHQIFPHFGMNDVGRNNSMLTSTSTHDHGLLQDIVPFLEKKEL